MLDAPPDAGWRGCEAATPHAVPHGGLRPDRSRDRDIRGSAPCGVFSVIRGEGGEPVEPGSGRVSFE